MRPEGDFLARATDARQVSLATLTLPPQSTLRRDVVVPPEHRGANFEAGYDFRTIAYDVIHLPRQGGTALVCPPLLNLARVLRRGEFRLDDRQIGSPRILRYRRHDVVLLPSHSPPRSLTLAFDGWRVGVDLPPTEAEAFAGRNCLLTLSRDNDPRWIRDWAAFHAREHGADAVLFLDNGSSTYAASAVLDTLAAVEGILVARVVQVDLPYGPIPIGGSRSRAMFLQTALWNVARLRFLSRARAVLPCDVDELVVRNGSRSVFDATVASWAGFLRYPGRWRAHALPPDETPLHRDHIRMPSDDRACPTKYCIAPSGRLGGFGWGTHNLIRLPFAGLFDTKEFSYLHCRGITTRWKGPTSRVGLTLGEVDAAAATLMRRHFE